MSANEPTKTEIEELFNLLETKTGELYLSMRSLQLALDESSEIEVAILAEDANFDLDAMYINLLSTIKSNIEDIIQDISNGL
jgi:hypothetical protein